MCVKGSLVLVLVLDWTQCLPQGVGAPPAMLRRRTAGFPKKLGAGPPERRGRWIQLAQSPRLWHTNHEQAVSVWCGSTSSMASSKSVEKSSSEWSRLWHNNWVDNHTDRVVLCSGN